MAHPSTQQRLLYCVVIAIVIAVLVATSFAYLRSRAERFAPLKSMDTWQQADVPLGYPLENKQEAPFDSRMLQLSAFERALIPSATRIESPMGTRQGALTYSAQPFWADNKKRGGHHAGDDIRMSVQILRGTVQLDVETQVQRPEIRGRAKSVVDQSHKPRGPAESDHILQTGHVEQRVGDRFYV